MSHIMRKSALSVTLVINKMDSCRSDYISESDQRTLMIVHCIGRFNYGLMKHDEDFNCMPCCS